MSGPAGAERDGTAGGRAGRSGRTSAMVDPLTQYMSEGGAGPCGRQ